MMRFCNRNHIRFKFFRTHSLRNSAKLQLSHIFSIKRVNDDMTTMCIIIIKFKVNFIWFWSNSAKRNWIMNSHIVLHLWYLRCCYIKLGTSGTLHLNCIASKQLKLNSMASFLSYYLNISTIHSGVHFMIAIPLCFMHFDLSSHCIL